MDRDAAPAIRRIDTFSQIKAASPTTPVSTSRLRYMLSATTAAHRLLGYRSVLYPMPKSSSQECDSIQAARVCQLVARPERTPLVAMKKYSADAEMRNHHASTNTGKIHQMAIAAAGV